MFLELIATVFAGIAMAGVVMVINRATGGRLPRWFAPVAAGAAMIGVTISSEYSWYGRTLDGMPDGLQVVQEVENKSMIRPWTYAVPFVDRFAAIDTSSIQRNPKLADQRLGDLYLFGRWAPVNKLPVLADCAGARRANLIDGANFDAEGAVIDASWVQVAHDDPVLTALCEAV